MLSPCKREKSTDKQITLSSGGVRDITSFIFIKDLYES